LQDPLEPVRIFAQNLQIIRVPGLLSGEKIAEKLYLPRLQ